MSRYFPIFLLLALVAGAREPIDEPIQGQTASDIFAAMRHVHQSLSKEDSAAFAAGVTGLTSQIKGWKKEEMTEPERDAYVLAVIRGMTPRQVIIVGSMVSALLYRTEYLEERAIASTGDKKLPFLKADADSAERLATQYLAHYSKKEANQTSEPTAPSGRGSS